MGFLHDSYGPNQIGTEERSESFYIHSSAEYNHCELLLSDVPHLLRALADLPTCPDEIRHVITASEGSKD